MLIAISGSQGAGKSSVLQDLEQLGYNVVSRKTSRSILSDWNVSLQEVNNNSDLTIKFQDEIIRRKSEDEHSAVVSDDIWFTERTYMDLATYALIALGKDNQYSDWLNSYMLKCIERQQQYAHVFYLKAGHFAPEHDGVRGSNPFYSRMADIVMQDMTAQSTMSCKLTMVDTPLREQRVVIIKSFSDALKK